MSYQFPDEDTLAKYQALLMAIMVEVRFIACFPDTPCKQIAALVDAVHNVPDLICRWPDMKEEYILADLERMEREYYEGKPRFSRILTEGPREGWQLKWSKPNSA